MSATASSGTETYSQVPQELGFAVLEPGQKLLVEAKNHWQHTTLPRPDRANRPRRLSRFGLERTK